MNDAALGIVHHIGAASAAFLPGRVKHEVIDNELAMVTEKVAQIHTACRSFEDVLSFDFHHGELAPLRAQCVALPGELFLLGSNSLRARSHSSRETTAGMWASF